MAEASSFLPLKFQTRDTEFGVTRATLQAMAARLHLSEAEVAHLALARLARAELLAYDADDGPLSRADLTALDTIAAGLQPRGKVVRTRSLFSEGREV